jgi:uncharacterized repeat protein (TIGR03837 family)
MPAPSHWDIFCSVVDNYGDAGIAWRLARILASEHGLPVRLYIDAPMVLARLVPGIDPAQQKQRVEGLDVLSWLGPHAALSQAHPGAVVIEAFGCGLPEAYLRAMAARDKPPVWINLEYLSAERWIEDCHGLASRHPTLPLTRYFFFPGFTAASGGLLREGDLFARRDAFRADAGARAALWRALGVPDPSGGAILVSLFCYPHAPVASLLDAWSGGDASVVAVVPEGVADHELERWSGSELRRGQPCSRGQLTLARVPFVRQDDYDRILWSCDLNFVRGEDSFVRAQWAARPLIWNVYPQAEDAHRLKLDAFLDRYRSVPSGCDTSPLAALSRAWNGSGDVGLAWMAVSRSIASLTAHAEAWTDALTRVPELGTSLATFCLNRI